MSVKLGNAFCPACGHRLWVDLESDGMAQLVCDYPPCPRSDAAGQILSEQQGLRHIIRVDADGYSVKHPLIERLDDALLDCALANTVARLGRTWVNLGRMQEGVSYYAYLSSIGSVELSMKVPE